MHTHRHGHLASAWRVRRDPMTGADRWTQLDRRDPRQAQSFYALDPSKTLTRGDRVAFRCTMMNFGSSFVRQGLASSDEMCDLYLLYYTEEGEGGAIEGPNFCWSEGLPAVTWKRLGFNNIPEEAKY